MSAIVTFFSNLCFSKSLERSWYIVSPICATASTMPNTAFAICTPERSSDDCTATIIASITCGTSSHHVDMPDTNVENAVCFLSLQKSQIRDLLVVQM